MLDYPLSIRDVYLLSLEYWGLALIHLGLKISSVHTLSIADFSSVRTMQCPLLLGDCPLYIGDCPLYIRDIYTCPLSIGDCLLSLRDVWFSSVRTIQCPLLLGDCPLYIRDCALYIRDAYFVPWVFGTVSYPFGTYDFHLYVQCNVPSCLGTVPYI